MNLTEKAQNLNERLEGIYFGNCIQNNNSDDPSSRTVKIRVNGVYNEPVTKDDIPWAYPLVNCKPPALGDTVGVIFVDGDITKPFYLTINYLDKARIQFFQAIYNKVINEKKSSNVGSIVVDDTNFTEPQTQETSDLNILKQTDISQHDIASETSEGVNEGSPQKANILSQDSSNGKEVTSYDHMSGTFVEVQNDGSVIIHGVKDLYEIVEGNSNEYSKGNKLLKVDGNLKIDASSIFIKGEVTFRNTVKLAPLGTVTPIAGEFGFCGLTTCVFSGASHASKTYNKP